MKIAEEPGLLEQKSLPVRVNVRELEDAGTTENVKEGAEEDAGDEEGEDEDEDEDEDKIVEVVVEVTAEGVEIAVVEAAADFDIV